MTDRLHRERSLPAGFQFGDGRRPRPYQAGDLKQGDVVTLGSSATRWRVSEREGVISLKPIGDWNDLERGEH